MLYTHSERKSSVVGICLRCLFCNMHHKLCTVSMPEVVSNGAFPLHGMARYGTVHFWGVFHWVLYLVPDTFLVPLRSRFHASRYRYQNVTCKLCWLLIGLRKSSLLRHWTCDTRPSSTALPARFKPAQPAKDRTQLLFKQTHIFASTTK